MISILITRPSQLAHTRAPRTPGHVCANCGRHFSAHPGEHLAGIYCPECLDADDEPLTAEHYWDLGGGD